MPVLNLFLQFELQETEVIFFDFLFRVEQSPENLTFETFKCC